VVVVVVERQVAVVVEMEQVRYRLKQALHYQKKAFHRRS
jgi:hypothetical protein